MEVEINTLLNNARQGVSDDLGTLLQLYRNYLSILADTQIGQRLRVRVSPSDIVQETMLAAHRDFQKFRGCTEREFMAWLRQVLINTIHRTVDTHLKAKRRDVRREVSIEVLGKMDQSAIDFLQAFADRGPSPSEPLREREAAVALADQLAKLRPQYREVIVLRNLQGLSFQEVAQRMDRSTNAVRMLWLRAIEKFKHVYQPSD